MDWMGEKGATNTKALVTVSSVFASMKSKFRFYFYREYEREIKYLKANVHPIEDGLRRNRIQSFLSYFVTPFLRQLQHPKRRQPLLPDTRVDRRVTKEFVDVE